MAAAVTAIIRIRHLRRPIRTRTGNRRPAATKVAPAPGATPGAARVAIQARAAATTMEAVLKVRVFLWCLVYRFFFFETRRRRHGRTCFLACVLLLCRISIREMIVPQVHQ